MKTRTINSVISTVAFTVSMMISVPAISRANSDQMGVNFQERRLNGPRLGFSGVIPGSEKYKETLEDKGIRSNSGMILISQFGWHFEWLIAPENGGPSFLIEFIPFIGGVEYGTIIPSASMVMGIRLPKGFEFGMGPSVIVTATKDKPVISSLVIGLGKSINYQGVSIPLNLAYSHNPDGHRVSFVFGYALPEKKNRRVAGNKTKNEDNAINWR